MASHLLRKLCYASKSVGKTIPSSLKYPRRTLVLAAGVTTAGGIALVNIVNCHGLRAESNPWELSTRPSPVPSRVMDYGLDLGMKLTLYQYQTCPFCCKARAFLDYYGISYDVVEVNSVKRTELKWSKYPKVPVLIVETPDGKSVQINDSSQIVSVMKTFIDNELRVPIDQILKCYPHFEQKDDGYFTKTTFDFPNKYFVMYFDEAVDTVDDGTRRLRNRERKWRAWVDSDFVHRISPNIYRTFSESFRSFTYFSEVGRWNEIFSAFDRFIVVYLGGFVMRMVAASLKRKHGLDDDVRGELYRSARHFLDRALKNRRFTGGDEITLADLALYGALTSFEGCDAFVDLTENTKIMSWFTAMKRAVESHEGQKRLREIMASGNGTERPENRPFLGDGHLDPRL